MGQAGYFAIGTIPGSPNDEIKCLFGSNCFGSVMAVLWDCYRHSRQITGPYLVVGQPVLADHPAGIGQLGSCHKGGSRLDRYSRPFFLGVQWSQNRSFFYLIYVVSLGILVAVRISTQRLATFMAIREDESSAESMGFPQMSTKLQPSP